MAYWRKLWGSLPFRMSVLYGALSIVSLLALLAFVSLQVIGALNANLSQQISTSMQRLMVEYEDGGLPGVQAAIALTLSDRIDSEREIYLLRDPQGNKLAGNLDAIELVPLISSEIPHINVLREGVPTEGKLRVRVLEDGSVLIVGHDLREVGSVKNVIERSTVTGVIVALLLVALGTYIYGHELDRRVRPIRRTASQIRAGNLSGRIPAGDEQADEFAVLNRDINAMLDRIEALMHGVRHVSDTIAHNLRTPLTRLMGRLQRARQPGLPPHEVAALVDSAIAELEGLNVLFGKLLQIAEIESGVRRRSFEPCSLGELLTDLVDMYEPVAEDAGRTLRLVVQRDTTIQGDPDLLVSAVSNLVENALKYSTNNVEITLCRPAAGLVTLTVCDDGPGVAHEHLARLGKHFFRCDTSVPGHGLGLASVAAIAKLHDARLTFLNAKPGLRVHLAFPVGEVAVAAPSNITKW